MMMRKHLTLLMLSALCACGYDDFGDYPPQQPDPQLYNIAIGDLRAFYVDKPLHVTEDMIVQGSVTSSDKGGNFFRTFVIEDATGAMEIRAGLYDLHNIYPVGQRLTIHLRGLTIAMEDGLLQAGATPLATTYYQTEYFGSRPILDKFVIREGIYSPVTALRTSISALTPAMCGRLVTIPSLVFDPAPEPTPWGNPSDNPNIPPTTGYRRFHDAAGEAVLITTSGYADFAAEIVPEGVPRTITGILLYGPAPGSGGHTVYMVKIRDLVDVAP